MRRLVILVSLLASTVAYAADLKTGTPEEVRADFDLVCNLPERSHTQDIKDEGEKAQKMAAYLKVHLKTEQVTKILALMGSVAADKQVATFMTEVRRAGYTGPCPFVENAKK
jgi:hypothetical protein